MVLKNKSKNSNTITPYILEKIKEEYPLLGARLFSEKYNLSINLHTLRCLTYRMGIKLNKEKLSERMDDARKMVDKEKMRKKVSFSNTKYNYENKKKTIIYEFNFLKSASAIAKKLNLNEYAVKKYLKLWNIKLLKNKKYTSFSEDERRFITNKKDIHTIKEFSSILNKTPKQIKRCISELDLKRNWRQLQKDKTILFNKTDNPCKRPEVRIKRSLQMKEFIKNNPEKLLNNRLRRNIMTSLERKMFNVLTKNNIYFKYNKYVNLDGSYKFPDFNIDDKLIIECDGKRFHTGDSDIERDYLFIKNGYTILHFTEDEINKNIEEVKQCILQKLKELHLQENRILAI